MTDHFGDGVDTTAQSVIWVDGEDTGKSIEGETVDAPTPLSVEETLRGEIVDLLQDGGLEFLQQILPDTLFIEDVKQKESDVSDLPEETPNDEGEDI
jgi:hypothetical protein